LGIAVRLSQNGVGTTVGTGNGSASNLNGFFLWYANSSAQRAIQIFSRVSSTQTIIFQITETSPSFPTIPLLGPGDVVELIIVNNSSGQVCISCNVGSYSHSVAAFTPNSVLLTGQPGLGVSNGLVSASTDASVYSSSWEGSILAPA